MATWFHPSSTQSLKPKSLTSKSKWRSKTTINKSKRWAQYNRLMSMKWATTGETQEETRACVKAFKSRVNRSLPQLKTVIEMESLFSTVTEMGLLLLRALLNRFKRRSVSMKEVSQLRGWGRRFWRAWIRGSLVRRRRIDLRMNTRRWKWKQFSSRRRKRYITKMWVVNQRGRRIFIGQARLRKESRFTHRCRQTQQSKTKKNADPALAWCQTSTTTRSSLHTSVTLVTGASLALQLSKVNPD